MVKCTTVDRRLFVDFLLNYVARKLSFNYEILKKSFNKKSEGKNFIDWCYFYLFEYQMSWFDCTAKHDLFPLICFPTKESIVARVVRRSGCVRSVIVIWAYSGRTRYQQPVTLSVTSIYCFLTIANGKCKLGQCVGFLYFQAGWWEFNLHRERDHTNVFSFLFPPPTHFLFIYFFPPRC